jgi:branched-chain amino acid aminotransferase
MSVMNNCSGDYFVQNGNFKNCSELSGRLFETGFSVYEVLRIVNGKCLFLDDHLKRLTDSVNLSGFVYNINIENLTSDIGELIVKNNRSNGNIKIVLNFELPENSPSLFVYFIPHYYPSVNQYLMGVDVDLKKFVRNDPNVKKIISYGTRSNSDSIYESLLVDENDRITEGSKSNIFFIAGHEIITAPDDMVLKGITRQKVITVIKGMNLTIKYEALSINELKNIDAVFLTGTSPKVLPVKSIGNFTYNAQNEIMKKIMHNYNTLVNSYLCDII